MAAMTVNPSDKAIAQHQSGKKIALEHTESGLDASIIVDLKELTTNPENYDFFTFRPNLEKLILAGTPDSKHISILWYTIPGGSVDLHYHAMTEAVYTIDGTQADAEGVYPTGSLHFSPPGSGHQVSNSTGFFLLAYAAPPNFINTGLIGKFVPVHIDTTDPNLATTYRFEAVQNDVFVYDIPLVPEGGITSKLIKSNSLESYEYLGNYLLVLEGRCTIDGMVFGKDTLVVAKTIEPQAYKLSATAEDGCLVLGLSF